MDDEDKLAALRERALFLDKAVKHLDYDIERVVHSVAAGTFDTGRAIGTLREKHNDQLGFMYDLGKVEAQIADLENRMQEQAERGAEHSATEGWQRDVPLEPEDYLDWLRPALDAPEPERVQEERHPRHDDEERMLDHAHREGVEPEDYLDWWKR